MNSVIQTCIDILTGIVETLLQDRSSFSHSSFYNHDNSAESEFQEDYNDWTVIITSGFR